MHNSNEHVHGDHTFEVSAHFVGKPGFVSLFNNINVKFFTDDNNIDSDEPGNKNTFYPTYPLCPFFRSRFSFIVQFSNFLSHFSFILL